MTNSLTVALRVVGRWSQASPSEWIRDDGARLMRMPALRSRGTRRADYVPPGLWWAVRPNGVVCNWPGVSIERCWSLASSARDFLDRVFP